MKKTEENAHLMAEKARVSEEEALVLSKRASEAEAECQRMKLSQIKVEFEIHFFQSLQSCSCDA